jgi:hypothetical protein
LFEHDFFGKPVSTFPNHAPARFRAKHALGLDPGAGTGSREENASKQEIGASIGTEKGSSGHSKERDRKPLELRGICWHGANTGHEKENAH